MEDQAFSQSYDLAPLLPPLPLRSVSKLDRRYTERMRKWDNWLMGVGGEGGMRGGRGAKSDDDLKAWSSINYSILSCIEDYSGPYLWTIPTSTAWNWLFFQNLLRWKERWSERCVQGSLYKLICRELLLFLVVYILLGVIYRQLMSPAQKEYAQIDAVKRFLPLFFFNLPLDI